VRRWDDRNARPGASPHKKRKHRRTRCAEDA
jgi:hypothetical protein